MEAGWRAVAILYNALMTGLVLSLVSRQSLLGGEAVAADFVFRHFRRQHLEKFLPGLEKLGLADQPPAIAAALYHFHSNALGGVKTEYFAESPTKAWVRYPPPRWIWRGAAVCGVPTSVNAAMLHGWHGHNGVSLNEPRLGFVCTGQITEGDPGLEGYYHLADAPLAENQRVRFVPDERMPRFDLATQPTLPTAEWPPERLARTHRAYAVEYLRSLTPTLQDLLGPAEGMAELARTARLIGLQYQEEVAGLLPGLGPLDLIAALLEAHGEAVERDGDSLIQTGWKTMAGVNLPDEAPAFDAWTALFGGMVSAADRFSKLEVKRSGPTARWRINSADPR
ncbi:hypothetical protein QO010_003599 [Caulobacter ginsengisoli]|uniref:Uncharacterized protein n=1 Tax=Caulobacter ginsengisoli TaxID=400775 RepID=A0ABU0IUW7_9CAUL|nr:hypothetical protein [Caulobacter ginsengisoli]MDQ0465807.1 hypothetical protein [Caulobacter ginsengisoli]